MLPSEIPKLPTDPLVRGFSGVWKLLFYDSLPGTSPSPSPTLLSLFLSFVLPPFKDNRLPFGVPGVLHQHSEVVLWYLLSVQIIFQWICGGESGLPVLFLCHLRTTPPTIKYLGKIICTVELPWWPQGKEFACNAGDLGSIPALWISPGGGGNIFQYSYLEDLHEQRCLEGYSPELDMTERLSA